jgi:GT2 family glycosyltransferase
MKKQVNIIIPFHSNNNLLDICVDSILKTTPDTVGIIIVVNNSNRDYVDSIRFDSERIDILRFYENLYYPSAVNKGALHSNAEYLIFCDSDICCLPGWYESLTQLYNSNSNIGYAGVKLLDPSDKSIIDFGIFASKYNFSHPYKGRKSSFPLAIKNRKFQAICAATSMIRRDLFIDKLNGFNENLVQAYADIDLSFRLKQIGLEVWGAADACVFHQGNSTNSGMSTYLKSDAKGLLFQETPSVMQIDMQQYFSEASSYFLLNNQLMSNYLMIDMTTIADKHEHYKLIENLLNIEYYGIYNFPPKVRDIPHIRLYDFIPQNICRLRVPFIYFVDDFRSIRNNALWSSIRNISKDIIIDRNANILRYEEL